MNLMDHSGRNMEGTMEPVKDASHLYEVERRASHAARPGFRIMGDVR